MPDQFPELPTHLLLYEEGSWRQCKLDMSTMNADPDNQQWLHVGWQIQSRSGQIFFCHQDLTVIESWLVEHNYVDTGDGAHYQKKTDKNPKKKKGK